jgi:hypothetical protein
MVSFEGAVIASAAGLDVDMNRCFKMEHGRFNGTLDWGGMNTEIVSARKTRPHEHRLRLYRGSKSPPARVRLQCETRVRYIPNQP